MIKKSAILSLLFWGHADAAQLKTIKPMATPLGELSSFDLGTPAYQSESTIVQSSTQPKSLKDKASSTSFKLIKRKDSAQKALASLDPKSIEFFTKKSLADLTQRNIEGQEPLAIAWVSLQHTIPSMPGTPSIEEAEEAGNEPELVQIAKNILVRKKLYIEQQKKSSGGADEVIKPFSPTEHRKKEKSYEAALFNAWRYDGFPLSAKKIANPESRDPEDARYDIKGVEYYTFDPASQSFIYDFSDVSLVGSESAFYTAWLNAHQDIDPFTKALASAELGNLYAQKGKQEDAQKYFTHALEQKDSVQAQALANYYLGKSWYERYLHAPGNGKQKLIEKALPYLKEAYQAQSEVLSEPVRAIGTQAAYYLGLIYDEVPSYKDEKKAKEYFNEAMDDPELRPLIMDRLSEPKTISTCCGFGIFKKRNKVAPERTSVYRKSAF